MLGRFLRQRFLNTLESSRFQSLAGVHEEFCGLITAFLSRLLMTAVGTARGCPKQQLLPDGRRPNFFAQASDRQFALFVWNSLISETISRDLSYMITAWPLSLAIFPSASPTSGADDSDFHVSLLLPENEFQGVPVKSKFSRRRFSRYRKYEKWRCFSLFTKERRKEHRVFLRRVTQFQAPAVIKRVD